MTRRLVVFAVGNPSRGDDALGPLLLQRLEQARLPGVVTVEDFQLQIEHALDLRGRELALFIDAGENTPAPYVFERIFPSTAVAHTTHELPPEAVLQVYRQTEDCDPPPSFVLCVRGERFELGEALSAEAQGRAGLAMALLGRLLGRPVLADWQALAAVR